jgi:membrane fusion protein (multidrug efflux system)
MKIFPITISCSALFLIVFALSCKKQEEKAAVVPEVNFIVVGQQSVPLFAEYVGETYGQSDVEIKPRVEGWIEKIHFREGSTVTAGEILYSIQDDELQDRLASSQAVLAQAQVLLVKAKADLDRVKPLVEMNALSKRDLDAAQAGYDAQVQAVAAANAQLNNSQTQLSYSTIRSPITGTIGISKVQVGDYVSKSVGQNSINAVSAVGALRVRFAISENDYLQFKRLIDAGEMKNPEVQFILSDGSVFPEVGRIDFADRTVDAATGSLLVQAVVDNKTRILKPGQYVKVRFVYGEVANAMMVPQQAVNQLQNIYQVYVVNDSSKIIPRTVKPGVRIGSNWVITEGLKAGEKVALLGNAIVKPGMLIKPVEKAYSYDSTSVTK